MSTIRKIWYAIYPTDNEHKWMPLMWLPFMLWFFLDPYWRHASPLHWIWNTAAGLFFIYLYLQAFSRPVRAKSVCIALMLLMAVIFVPINSGAVGFLIYTAAAVGFNPKLRWVILLLGIDIGILLFYAYRLNYDVGNWGSLLMLITLVGLGNHHWASKECAQHELRVANEEIEHLAKVAERERIARDLHDVLGHTLSLITLKSELARKLVDRDPDRAKQEMQEVETASRAALVDVREAIRGYRSDGIFAELARARAALETAGVTVQCETDPVSLSPAQESVLALALREAVTNVVRHAAARRCNVSLRRNEVLCTLEVADDGCGAAGPEGNGLRGMRERLEALGGSLRLLSSNGTHLIIDLPLASAAPALRN
ncbi:MAG TPA: sensor histidine kinase [Candidatus Angelobacter sp.]|nr:sensor histidine kinase [Candidatus Angelobacter sp.]